jgi:hypothetical protein
LRDESLEIEGPNLEPQTNSHSTYGAPVSKLPSQIQPSDFSSHLFWDVDVLKIDLQRTKRWMVERVVEYGSLSDWKMLNALYGKEEIKNQVVAIRNLDEVTCSFLCVVFELKKEDFRCYTYKQSTPDFWKS